MTYPHDTPPNDGRRPGPEDEEGPLMPAADYPITCIAAKLGYAGTKNEQIGARLRIIDGPLKGKTMLWYGSFSENAQEFTIKAMRAMGFTGNDPSDLSSMINNDVQAIAVVQHDEYQGKKRAKVAWINGADVQMKDEMNQDELKAFAHRMRGVFARYGGNVAARPPMAPTTRPDPRDERQRPAPPPQQRDFRDRDPWDRS